jgi:hypothetical protein
MIRYRATNENYRTFQKEYQSKYKMTEESVTRAKVRINHHENERYRVDPEYKIRKNLRNRMGAALRGNFKSGSAVRDLGCTIAEAMIYWQALPTWNSEWTWADQGNLFHIDHIDPLMSFDLTDREQFLLAAHYTNQQPLGIEIHKEKTRRDLLRMKSKSSSNLIENLI